MIDAVILVGGKGSRLGPLTKKTPKPLIKINNQVFLDILLSKILKYNFNKIYLICSFKKEKFFKIYHNKILHNSKIICIDEGSPKDTGGALYKIKKFIKNDFILINGDTYFDIDISRIINTKFKNSICTIAITKNNNNNLNHKINNIHINKKKIIQFSKIKTNLMNGGVYFFKKKIFKSIIEKKCSLENDILKRLIEKKKIHGIYFKEKFIDIGSHKTIKFLKKNKDFLKQKVIFLDRDGVINRLRNNDYVKNYNEFKFLPSVSDAISYIKKKNYLVIIITNQACVGKSIISKKKLNLIHDKMQKYLKSKNNAHVDDIFFSPYYKYSNNIKYRNNIIDRKPNPGMLIKAIKKWNIDKKKSFFIGDSLTDYEAAKKIKIKFYYKDKSFLLNQLKRIL
ncbi:HAD-IIIA family hydrolase [Candidatus Pelagibacter sp.]|nr:HAD-IIIA family hydrolase [Candidatus Pelagibacter sp.]